MDYYEVIRKRRSVRKYQTYYYCYPIMGGSWRRAIIMKPSRFIQELSPESYEEWIVKDEIPQLLEKIEQIDNYSR